MCRYSRLITLFTVTEIELAKAFQTKVKHGGET